MSLILSLNNCGIKLTKQMNRNNNNNNRFDPYSRINNTQDKNNNNNNNDTNTNTNTNTNTINDTNPILRQIRPLLRNNNDLNNISQTLNNIKSQTSAITNNLSQILNTLKNKEERSSITEPSKEKQQENQGLEQLLLLLGDKMMSKEIINMASKSYNSHNNEINDRPKFSDRSTISSGKYQENTNYIPIVDGMQYDYRNNKITFQMNSGYKKYNITKTIHSAHNIFDNKRCDFKVGYYCLYNLAGQIYLHNYHQGIDLFKNVNELSNKEKKYIYFEISDKRNGIICFNGDPEFTVTVRDNDSTLYYETEEVNLPQNMSQEFDIKKICFSFVEFDTEEEKRIHDDQYNDIKGYFEDLGYFYFVSIRDIKFGTYFPNGLKDKYLILKYMGSRFPKSKDKDTLSLKVSASKRYSDIYTLSILQTRRDIRYKRFTCSHLLNNWLNKYNIYQILPKEVTYIVAKYL